MSPTISPGEGPGGTGQISFSEEGLSSMQWGLKEKFLRYFSFSPVLGKEAGMSQETQLLDIGTPFWCHQDPVSHPLPVQYALPFSLQSFTLPVPVALLLDSFPPPPWNRTLPRAKRPAFPG